MEVFVDDETKLTLHGLQQYYVKLKDSEKNRKLFDLLDVLEFNQVTVISSRFYSQWLWKWALVNSNGLFGCNLGGDICQVSSTLCGSVSAAGGTEFSSHCDSQGNGSGGKVRHLLIPWYCNGWVKNANSEIFILSPADCLGINSLKIFNGGSWWPRICLAVGWILSVLI